MKIDSCICYQKSFRRIHTESIRDGIDTVEDLKRIKNICNKCEMCNPYLEITFKKGVFEFNDIIID